MAKLTRMQKYAGLREQMAHDRETQVSTNDLSKFEDKLKTMQGISEEENILVKEDKPVEETPVIKEDKKTFSPVSEDLRIEQNEKSDEESFLDFLASLDDDIDSIKKEAKAGETIIPEFKDFEIESIQAITIPEAKQGEIVELEAVEVKEEPAVEQNETLIEETTFVEPEKQEEINKIPDFSFIDSLSEELNKIEEDLKVEETPKEEIAQLEEIAEEPVQEIETIETIETLETAVEATEEKPLKVEEIIHEVDESYDEIAKHLEEINVEINGELESIKEEKEEPVEVETVIEEKVEIEAIEQLNVHEEAKEDFNNDFILDALKEANEYNKNDGQKTIDEISQSMIESIRHPESAKEEKEIQEQPREESKFEKEISQANTVEEVKENNKPETSDSEFSNTVTLEIDKVLNEIKAEAAMASTEIKIDTPVKAEDVKPEEFAEKIANTFEHPVLTKKLEDEPIEIKSMEETLRQDVLDDTIPFVMNNEEDDEFEEEAPNKVLNIILVILIIILVAILGVIVYFILFEKGIIGA